MNRLNSIDLLGNSSIGIFAVSTNTYSIFPSSIKLKTLKTVEKTLSVPVINTTIANCNLIGLFACGNSHHLVLPDLISEYEYESILANLPDDVETHVFNSRITALGNSIVCNDSVAVVHTEFPSDEVKLLQDYLDVEIIQKKLIDNPLVGSMIFRNDFGFLTHPLVAYEELEWLSDLFKTRGDVVTINRGTPYPRPGIVGNKNGILIGSDSSGPELMRIYEILLS